MTLPLPVSVRLSNARTDKHIERDLRSLSFRHVVPGGCASVQFSLDRPLASSPDELAYYTDVDVYDMRNANWVAGGRLEDPGRGVGADGQVWELAAVGPSAHAQDKTIPIVFVDRSLEHWYRVMAGATIAGSVSNKADASTDPGSGDDTPALLFHWTQGITLATNAEGRLRHSLLNLFGQKLAAYDYNWDAGGTSTEFLIESISRAGDGSPAAETNTSQAFDTAGGSPAQQVVVTDFANGHDVIDLRVRYTGAGQTRANDAAWLSVTGMYVKAMLHNADGTEKTTGYTGHTLLASDVVKDLLGRLLPQYDGAGATVATTSYGIDHLMYPDGANPAQIFSDLMAFDPGYYWAAWERNAAGKHRFEWRAWPTTVRYECDAVDGYSSTGSADQLFNEAVAVWRDDAGRYHRTGASQTVAELDAVGLERSGFLNLGQLAGSSDNAVQVLAQFLAEHAVAPNAGALTVARPIYDHDRGRMVQPWEIRPGHLIRVRGIQPNVNSLNATGRDGVTVFQIVGVDYNTGSASATLELDSYSPTIARALASMGGGTRGATRGDASSFGAWAQRQR